MNAPIKRLKCGCIVYENGVSPVCPTGKKLENAVYDCLNDRTKLKEYSRKKATFDQHFSD